MPFYGYNRPGAKVSEGVRESFWLQGMMAGFPAAYFCIKAFSETDQTEDLKKFDVPTLIIQGDDDQIVPFADAGAASVQARQGRDAEGLQGRPARPVHDTQGPGQRGLVRLLQNLERQELAVCPAKTGTWAAADRRQPKLRLRLCVHHTHKLHRMMMVTPIGRHRARERFNSSSGLRSPPPATAR